MLYDTTLTTGHSASLTVYACRLSNVHTPGPASTAPTETSSFTCPLRPPSLGVQRSLSLQPMSWLEGTWTLSLLTSVQLLSWAGTCPATSGLGQEQVEKNKDKGVWVSQNFFHWITLNLRLFSLIYNNHDSLCSSTVLPSKCRRYFQTRYSPSDVLKKVIATFVLSCLSLCSSVLSSGDTYYHFYCVTMICLFTKPTLTLQYRCPWWPGWFFK